MKSYIGTAELIWHENDEYEVLTDPSGWKVVFVMNHYKNEFWYELKDPNGHYLNEFYDTAFKAVEAWQRIMSIKEEELRY